jgi:hypothetical protein
MYGANPAFFKNIEAAILAARAYAIEEGVDYGVYEKTPFEGHPTCYKPVSAHDHNDAVEDGYSVLISPGTIRASEMV